MGEKSFELSNCPDESHCWFHCCRGKTLGLQIRLLPWSWRRYQVRRHQKENHSSQWLPRWADPFQNPCLKVECRHVLVALKHWQSLACPMTDLYCLLTHYFRLMTVVYNNRVMTIIFSSCSMGYKTPYISAFFQWINLMDCRCSVNMLW